MSKIVADVGVDPLPFGQKLVGNSSSLDSLIAMGFSPDEARGFLFLQTSEWKATNWGLGLSFLSLYYFKFFKGYSIPARLAMGGLTFGVCAGSASWFFTAPRINANTPIGNLLSNNRFRNEQNALVRNFRCFNRLLTPDEITKFKHNERVQAVGPRKFIANPYVHGADMEKQKQENDWLNDEMYTFSEQSKAQIEALEKERGTERLVTRYPFNFKNFLDVTGEKRILPNFTDSIKGKHIL